MFKKLNDLIQVVVHDLFSFPDYFLFRRIKTIQNLEPNNVLIMKKTQIKSWHMEFCRIRIAWILSSFQIKI